MKYRVLLVPILVAALVEPAPAGILFGTKKTKPVPDPPDAVNICDWPDWIVIAFGVRLAGAAGGRVIDVLA